MKRKIFIIAVAVCLAVLSIAGSSIAYFTDVEEATNVFTAGNVNIKLTYDGKDVELDDDDTTNDILDITNTKVYPGQEFNKKAMISNVGSEDAYVAAIITLTNENGKLSDVITAAGDTDNIPVAIRGFFTELVYEGYTVKIADITNGYAIFIIKTTALAGKTDTATDGITLFEKIVIPAEWDNAEMQRFSGMKVSVKAYATQVPGFDDAEDAITSAFDTTKYPEWGAYATALVLPAPTTTNP